MYDSRHMWRKTSLAVAMSCALIAVTSGSVLARAATETSPAPAAQQTPWGRAVPLSVGGPAWFDTNLYRQVVSAGSRGVPLSAIPASKRSGTANSADACAGSAGAGPTSSAVPTTPNGVERPPVGIGPGTWLISLFCTNVGGVPVPDGFAWCTANFAFQNGSSFGVGTAGHCAAKDALASPVTAVVTPPPEVCANGGSCAPGLYAIGTFSIARNSGLGNDFALLSLYPAFNSWVRPAMPVFGGPTGSYTGGLATAPAQTLSAGPGTVLTPAWSPAVIAHCGHGAV